MFQTVKMHSMVIKVCIQQPGHPTVRSSEHYIFGKPHYSVWSGVRNPTVNLVAFKVSKKPVVAPNL